jgi:hypothetical protein
MRRAASGFTLAETVMAISMTVVVGLAVAGMTAALSNVQANSERYYKHLHNGRAGTNRLQATLRKARLVTAASDNALILWATDVRDLGQINLTEVVRVYRDAATSQLIERRFVFPDTVSEVTQASLDDVIPLSAVTKIAVVDNAWEPTQYDTQRVLAHDVASFKVYCDTPAPRTRMVKFTLTVGEKPNTVQMSTGATLRADRVANVGESGGEYFLIP